MKKMYCEICDSTKIKKQKGIFVCKECGTEYSPEEARNLLRDKKDKKVEKNQDDHYVYDEFQNLIVISDITVKVLPSQTNYTECRIFNIDSNLFEQLTHELFVDSDGEPTLKVIAKLKQNVQYSGDACICVFINEEAFWQSYMQLETVSGDIYSEVFSGYVRANTVSGNISFVPGLFGVDFNTVSGSVSLCFCPNGDEFYDTSSIKTVSGDIDVSIASDLIVNTNFSTVSGSINNSYAIARGAQTSVDLNLTTISGDIIVYNHEE